jgi:hypothetical protein
MLHFYSSDGFVKKDIDNVKITVMLLGYRKPENRQKCQNSFIATINLTYKERAQYGKFLPENTESQTG